MNSNETALQAAARFASPVIKKGFKLEALHPYHDAIGNTLYYRMRFKHPFTQEKWMRPMHQGEKGFFVLKEPHFEHGKPLYNLQQILRSGTAEIWITEGELCADKLSELGLCATTSGGADSASAADWSPLQRKKIIIWPDNDEGGFKYATVVTQKLSELDCEVRWVNIKQLQLNQKDDCINWLNQNPDATSSTLLSLPTINPMANNEPVTDQMIPKAQGPARFMVCDEGVYYQEDDERTWLCSKLDVIALARDKLSENWGRLLLFKDLDGYLHQWAMPVTLLKGNGEEMRGELLRLGLIIAPGAKNRKLLSEYIASAQPNRRARCVSGTGWHNSVFVLPHRTIGSTSEHIIYQSDYHVKGYQSAGTLEEWQKEVAQYCQGNSRLVLAVSSAFASLLLYLVGAESGGIHFVGESSSGKTTALRVAASVFGSPQYLNRWRATTNGIEALAMMHNDALLVLDELAQVEPREAGEVAYMLANGTGKTRANKGGTAKTRAEWRLLFLSAGEVGLAQHMRECGKKAKAGQEVRLVDIPADAGANLGVFEHLQGLASPALLSNHLQMATSKTYGVAATAFLEVLTAQDKLLALPDKIKQYCQQFIMENLPSTPSGQIYRVCERFALIAIAGEMASHYGITGWQPMEAKTAAITCFNAWLEQRGSTGNQESATILSQIRGFFEAHGESRFTNWHETNGNNRTFNRAGFKKNVDGSDYFYVLPECFKHEVCAGLDYRSTTKLLLTEEWLQADTTSGTPYRRERLPTIGQVRCYVFTTKMWEA
jgi:putative DNA primase/helicase